MLVVPPWAQGVRWWAWQKAAGTSQVGCSQVACSTIRAMRWGSVKSRPVRNHVEDRLSGAEDRGDQAGLARHPAGLPGRDVFAGVELGGLEPAEQALEGHGDHHGGGDAAGVGELVGGVAGQVLTERLPEPLGAGLLQPPGAGAVHGVLVLGGCGGQQGLAEHRGVGGGDREPAVAQAVAVIGHREPGLRRGPLLLPLQGAGFVGVGAGGVGDLQDPLAQDPQHLRVVVLRGGEEVLLRPVGQVRDRRPGPAPRGPRWRRRSPGPG